MTMTPPQTEPDTQEPLTELEGSTPTQHDTGPVEDTASYAWLFKSLSRAATTEPWWRRWWNVAVDVVQSSWQSGFATISAANRSPRRRWFTIVAAGAAAVALSTTGVIAAVQENWTPARISEALEFDEPEPPPAAPDEPADVPDERQAPVLQHAPEADDERGARPDDAEAPAETGKRETAREGSGSDSSPSRRSQRDEDTAESGTAQQQEQAGQPEPDAAEPADEPAPAQEAAAAPATLQRSVPQRDPILDPGEVMRAGDTRESYNGLYTLVMQDDGNLVAYRNGAGAIWSTRTHGNPGAYTVNQHDGNVVVYGPSHALWSTRTAGTSGTVLVMQDDGNVVAYSGNTAVWASGTAQ